MFLVSTPDSRLQTPDSREAENELAEARLWYSIQSEGLDAALMERVDQTLSAITAAPNSYPIVIEVFDVQ